MRQFIFISIFFIISGLHAQELNCNLSVNTSRIQGTNKRVYNALEEVLRDFMNNTVFTNNVFESTERIECNILLDIVEEITSDEFKATLQIQARRPVYGTSYNSVLFNYVDNDIQFRFQESDAIDYTDNTFVSNLSSIFTYYALVIIGLDYDSFSPMGGTSFFQRAEVIVNAAQNSGFEGWRSTESRERKNRYWLIQNLLDNNYEVIRTFSYNFHRLGLDQMEKSMDLGRSRILDSLEDLEKLNNNKPDPFMSLMRVVLDSKSEEIVNIFSEAPTEQKVKVLRIMLALDPAGSRKYERLRQN